MSSTVPKILLVEDDNHTLNFVAHILDKFGYRFETAADGEDAVKKAAAYQPDCALLDYMMPRMNGLEAAVQIQKILPNCKVAFFTGNYDVPEFQERYRRSGFPEDLVIPKPFRALDVINLVWRAGFPPPLAPPAFFPTRR